MPNNENIVCVVKDQYGAFVYWNQALERHFSLPRDGMQDKTEYHFMSDPDAAAIRNNDQTVLRTGNVLSAVEFVHLPDGRKTAWLVHKFRIECPAQNFLGVIALQVQSGPTEPGLSIEEGRQELEPHLGRYRAELEQIAHNFKRCQHAR